MSELKQKVLILGANRYQFTNDRNQQIEGTSVHFCYLNSDDSTNRVGFKPEKVSFNDLSKFLKYESLEFPIVANALIVFVPNSAQKFRVKDFEFLSPVDLGVKNAK